MESLRKAYLFHISPLLGVVIVFACVALAIGGYFRFRARQVEMEQAQSMVNTIHDLTKMGKDILEKSP